MQYTIDKVNSIPHSPGVYLMKHNEDILYIGKAVNLKRRVSSYFNKAHDTRIQKMVSLINNIEIKKTDTAIEALILESQLITKYNPKYNIKLKDDKSFLYVEITKEDFPRILLVRGNEKTTGKRIGPFTSSNEIREALKLLRKIFPYHTHLRKPKKACFDYQIGLCPGVCIDKISKEDYKRNIDNLVLFLKGKKKRIITNINKQMKDYAKNLEFEEADKLKKQLFLLKNIQDFSLIKKPEDINNYRIEGYDISNISGTYAVGSMVVFQNGQPKISDYKKFKIRTIKTPNDTGMLREVLERRFSNDWTLPDLILIDGGKGQVNTAKEVLDQKGIKIPIIGIAKGPKRDKDEFIGNPPKNVKSTLIKARDEAHRFAISYHKKLRDKI